MLDSGPLCTLCQNAIHRGGRRCSACHAIMCLDCMEPTGVCIGCADVEDAPVPTRRRAPTRRGAASRGGLRVGPAVGESLGDLDTYRRVGDADTPVPQADAEAATAEDTDFWYDGDEWA